MAEFKVSVRYAESLMGIAEDKKNLDRIANDAELIISAMESVRELQLVLSNPVIKPELKLSILNEIFKSKISSDTLNFLKFVVGKGRENLLYDIMKSFMNLRDAKLGIANINVKTAFELDEKGKEELINLFNKILNKKIKFKYDVDPEMIGGFIATVDDTVYDASLKHQLELLRKQFKQGGTALN